MQLDHIPSGSDCCPLLRLSHFTAHEAQQLLTVAQQLASGQSYAVPLHELPFVFADRGCQLTLRLSDRDLGVVQLGDIGFACDLSPGGWCAVASSIEPFVTNTEAGRFQWLIGGLNTPHSPSLLLSPDGHW
jgi:hypothetical protein